MEIPWKRSTEIMDEVKVIVDGIKPSDIYQGSLGDCYFLSSISALAEHPSRVERLLISKEANEKGCYAVALNVCGDYRMVIVDDNFPLHYSRHQMIFCHSASAELWAMLLEKAYAKVFGGYWNIGTGGFAEDALKDLTGAPSEYDQLADDTDTEELWNKLYFCDQNEYIIVCGSMGSGEKKNEVGIILGHAYTIISCQIIKGERVLEMRNPWGDHNEWNGRWSDEDDSTWTPELREKYDMVNPEGDGRFFMPYDEFLNYFDQISYCFYEDNYTLSSFTDELQIDFLACYKFEITQPGMYYVSLSQPDTRGFEVTPDGEGKERVFKIKTFWILAVFSPY